MRSLAVLRVSSEIESLQDADVVSQADTVEGLGQESIKSNFLVFLTLKMVKSLSVVSLAYDWFGSISFVASSVTSGKYLLSTT